MNAHWQGRGIQYLVHYKGYGKEHDKWHSSSEMAKIDAFDR
jgi:hypothetical protein